MQVILHAADAGLEDFSDLEVLADGTFLLLSQVRCAAWWFCGCSGRVAELLSFRPVPACCPAATTQCATGARAPGAERLLGSRGAADIAISRQIADHTVP